MKTIQIALIMFAFLLNLSPLNSQSSATYAIQLATYGNNVDIYNIRHKFSVIEIYGNVLMKRFSNGITKVYLLDYDLSKFDEQKAKSITYKIKQTSEFKDCFLVNKIPLFDTYIFSGNTETGLLLNNSPSNVEIEEYNNIDSDQLEGVKNYRINDKEYFTIQLACLNSEKNITQQKLFLEYFEIIHPAAADELSLFYPEDSNKCIKYNYGNYDSEEEALNELQLIRDGLENKDILKGVKVKYYGPSLGEYNEPVDRTNKGYSIQIDSGYDKDKLIDNINRKDSKKEYFIIEKDSIDGKILYATITPPKKTYNDAKKLLKQIENFIFNKQPFIIDFYKVRDKIYFRTSN